MKIVLTGRELSAIKSIMEHTESGSVNELAKGLKDNKIISYSVQPLKKEIEIEETKPTKHKSRGMDR